MSDKQHWIIRIVPALAFIAGVIMASVGGIITISSALKLSLFETSAHTHITKRDCRYDYEKPLVVAEGVKQGNSYYERNEEELMQCIEDRKEQEGIRFKNSEKQDIVDGVSSLIVGGILLFAFRRRK